MFRQTVLPLCLLATLAFGATVAHAGDHPAPPPQDASHDDRDSGPPVPFAGYDVGYDYVIAHDHVDIDPYYNYQGPPPTDRRSHEQEGLRHGDLPIKPLTPYDAGVTVYGDDEGYGYGYSYNDSYSDDDCGCTHYRRRYNVYYDDFGNRGDSYSGYDDRRREDSGRGYGER